jgi:two-component system sensor histidine kinase KdpD
MGAASVLVEQTKGDRHAEFAGLASTIVEETEQLHRMTNNTLQMARLDAVGIELNKNWESLEEIIGTVIARIKRRYSDRQFTVHLPPDLPLLHVDVVLLMQLLDNVLQNSLKYSRDESVITIDAVSADHEVFIRLSDCGEGIPGWWHEKVFEIFQRVDGVDLPSDGRTGRQPRRGAGVGLAVCRAIARVHGGRIWIEDNPGGGTRVNIALPIGAPPALPLSASEELT